MNHKSVEFLRDYNDWRRGTGRYDLPDDAVEVPDQPNPVSVGEAIDWACEQIEWRPIETAPKSTSNGSHVHGIYVLGFCPEPDMCNLESAICVVWWEPHMKGGIGMWYGEGGYEVFPTHWMPLPPPPGDTKLAVQPNPQ